MVVAFFYPSSVYSTPGRNIGNEKVRSAQMGIRRQPLRPPTRMSEDGRGGLSLGTPPAGAPTRRPCTIWAQNAGRSAGLRLVTSVLGPDWHTRTSSSAHWPPALVMSVRKLGHDVSILPRTTSASTNTQGP